MIQVAQIIFILSVLVILHEFGHYITAKIFKMRVEKFYLFMDAGFSIFKKKIGETEWGIGWLPLGGYVKISGMIDESMDTEQLKSEPQPWEFRSKPAWQRLIVMLGGIIVNILLAWFIYTTMFLTVGKKYISTNEVQKNGLEFGKSGLSFGFKNGDKVVTIDGKPAQSKFNWMIVDMLLSDEIIVNRAGKEIKIQLTDEQKAQILTKEGREFVYARRAFNLIRVDSIAPNHITEFKKGDLISGINEKTFSYKDEFYDYLNSLNNEAVNVKIKRNEKDTTLVVNVGKNGEFGLDKNLFLDSNLKLSEVCVGEFGDNSTAEKAGMQINDQIIAINTKKIELYNDFKKILENNKGKSVILEVKNGSTTKSITVPVSKEGKIGIAPKPIGVKGFEIKEKLTFGEAIPAGLNECWNLFTYNIKQFKLILKPKTKAYTQVKSPIGIARQLPDRWNWEFIWNFTALFSIGLAFMNLLPIPGLDGGHALFTIIEMVTGKKLSDKAAERVQTAGMVILLTLMALTFGKDIYQLVIDFISKK